MDECCSLAVLGDGFTPMLAAQVSHQPEYLALSGIEELLARGLLRERLSRRPESPPVLLSFTHAKVREVASLELSAARRSVPPPRSPAATRSARPSPHALRMPACATRS